LVGFVAKDAVVEFLESFQLFGSFHYEVTMDKRWESKDSDGDETSEEDHANNCSSKNGSAAHPSSQAEELEGISILLTVGHAEAHIRVTECFEVSSKTILSQAAVPFTT
jgi:hypothetical protein